MRHRGSSVGLAEYALVAALMVAILFGLIIWLSLPPGVESWAP